MASTALMSCAALFPRFDNPLNPDIMFLNAGDVVDSVKCAATAFLLDRASNLEGRAKHLLETEFNEKRRTDIDDDTFCPIKDRDTDWTDPKVWRIALISKLPDKSGKLVCKEEHSLTDEILIWDRTTQRHRINWEKETLKKWAKGGLLDCVPGYKTYKFVTLTKSPRNAKKFDCRPNGGCAPGTYPTRSGVCAMDDSSRLALDPNGVAKIELTLTALNTGSMNYTRIDADRLDLRSIIVPGGGNNPFPMFKATDKNTNKVTLTVLLAQNILKPDDLDDANIKTIIKLFEEKKKETPIVKRRLPNTFALENLFPDARTPEYFTQKAYEDLLADPQQREFKKQCNFLKVDFLGLKRYIARMVDEQDKRIYAGPPNLSLESFILSTEFQITFDASAGTHGILRILPVLAAPTLGLVSDHTHSLKMTFNGAKNRALATNTFSLKQRCLERVTGAGVSPTDDPEAFCSSPQAIQLESLIDAVESKGAGG